MNRDLNLTDKQVEDLLQLAAKRIGTDPQKLRDQLQTGAFAPGGVSADRVNELIKNPKVLEQLLSTPQYKELLKNLMEGK